MTGLLAGAWGGALVAGPVAPALAAQDPTGCSSTVALSDGGFELPVIPDNSYAFLPDAQLPGWLTTATDRRIELWRVPFQGVPAGSGSQFAELNATQPSTLYQDLPTTPGQTLRWELQHRGRSGTDVMSVVLGPPAGVLVPQGNLSDGRTAWGTHSGSYTVPAGQTTTRFGFRAVSTAGGNPSVGNFLDSISFGTAACLVTTQTVTTRYGGPTTNVGELLTYTVTAANGGGNPAKGTVLTDVLPAGVTFVPGSIRAITATATEVRTDAAGDDPGEYDAATRTVRVRVGLGSSATAGGTIRPDDTRSFSYQVRVDTASAGATITDDATAQYDDDLSGRRLTSTSNPVSTPVNAAADLAMTVARTTPVLVAGRPAEWTATLTNNGPDAEPAARSTIEVPPLDGLVASTPGGSCTPAGREVVCEHSALAVGGSRTVTVTGTVPASETAGATYTFLAAAGAATFDQVPGNNARSVSDAVTTSADLAVELASGPGTAGDPVTYTATVHNAGPSVARAVRLVDPLQSDSTFLGATSAAGSCSFDPGTNTVDCPVGDLAPGGSAVVEVVVRLASTGTGAVDNTVWVASATADPEPADNDDSVAAAGSQRADLSVDLDVELSSAPGVPVSRARPGDELDFTLVVTNDGPSQAVNVSVSAVLPPRVRIVSVTGAGCTASGCSIPTLAAGNAVTLSGRAVVESDAGAGTVQASGSVISPTPDDDRADDTDTVSFEIELLADLAVTQTIVNPDDVGGPVVAGGRVVSRTRVTNAGPTRGDGIVLRQSVPAGQPVPAVATDVPGRGVCVLEGTETDGRYVDGAVVVCTLDTLAVGDSWEVTFDTLLRASSKDATYTRTRRLSAASPDPEPADNVSTLGVPVVRRSDLQVQKTTSTPRVVQTGRVEFQVRVTNGGPSDARDLLVREAPQPGVLVASAVPDVGSYSASNGAWRIPYLAVGDSALLDVAGSAESDQPVTNEARFLSAEGVDPEAGNDVAAAVVDVVPAARSLSISTSAIVTPPEDATAAVVADTIAFSYLVTNDGNVAMQGIAVTDALVGPAVCPQTELAPGTSMTCSAPGTYRVTQADFDAGQGVSNTATVTGSAPDSATPLQFGPAAATVPVGTAHPGLRAVKVANWQDTGSPGLDVGEGIDWTVLVENTGDVTLTDVQVADPAAPGMSCPLAVLAPGESTSCTAPTYRVVQADVDAGQKTNTATASAVDPRGGPRVLSGATSTASPSAPAPALGIALAGDVDPVERADAADVGDLLRWHSTVTNLGNVVVDQVAVHRPDGGAVTCAVRTLAPGASTRCADDAVHTVTEDDLLARGIATTAYATGVPPTASGLPAVRSADGQATAQVAAVTAAITLVTTSVNTSLPNSPAPAREGDLLRFGYLLRNAGNVSLAGIQVADPLVGPVTCASATLAGGATTTCEGDQPRPVTRADTTAGGVTSSATAVGEPPAASGALPASATYSLVVAAAAVAAPPVDPPPVAPGPVDPAPLDPAPLDPDPADPDPVEPGPPSGPGPVDPSPVAAGPVAAGPPAPAPVASSPAGPGARVAAADPSVPAAPRRGLAVTGAEVGRLAGWGLVLLAAGAGLLALSCRRASLRSHGPSSAGPGRTPCPIDP